MVVAIAGATGLTGRICLQKLLDHRHVNSVISIGRNETGIIHPNLTEVMLVNNKLSENVYAEAFICCLGTTRKKAGSDAAFVSIDRDLPVYLAKQLYNMGCSKAAVISSIGANTKSKFLYTRTKGELEDQLKDIGFSSLSILRPSFIIGKRDETRLGERIATLLLKLLKPLFFGYLKNYSPVSAACIAETLVRVSINSSPGTVVFQSGKICNG